VREEVYERDRVRVATRGLDTSAILIDADDLPRGSPSLQQVPFACMMARDLDTGTNVARPDVERNVSLHLLDRTPIISPYHNRKHTSHSKMAYVVVAGSDDSLSETIWHDYTVAAVQHAIPQIVVHDVPFI